MRRHHAARQDALLLEDGEYSLHKQPQHQTKFKLATADRTEPANTESGAWGTSPKVRAVGLSVVFVLRSRTSLLIDGRVLLRSMASSNHQASLVMGLLSIFVEISGQ